MHGVGTNGLIAGQQYDASFFLFKKGEGCVAPKMQGRVEGSGSSYGQGWDVPLGTRKDRWQKKRSVTAAAQARIQARREACA